MARARVLSFVLRVQNLQIKLATGIFSPEVMLESDVDSFIMLTQ
eukprot:SAG11_NODE_1057_length_6008_cov_3.405991_1_plen_44_part_00